MDNIFILLFGFSILIATVIGYSHIHKRRIKNNEILVIANNAQTKNLLEIKRQKLNNLRRYIHLNTKGEFIPENRPIFVTEELKSSSFLALGVLGGGIGGIGDSYYNIYSTFSDNEEFVNIMEERFNREFQHANKDVWLEKLKELNSSKSMRQTYVSNFTGYKAELLGKQKLEELGYQVYQYESRIHPNDDLVAISPSGTEVSFSVKSYFSINSLKNAVIEHPTSTHYIINDELATKISNSQVLTQWFKERNVCIINGGFSHSGLRKAAENSINAFNGMESSVTNELAKGAMENLLDGIPIATLVCACYKWKYNKNSLNNGLQSVDEYKINIAGDGVGLAGRAAAVAALGKLGALAGVSFGPAGIVVGGFIGGLLGATGVSKLISKSKDAIKWGDIHKTQKEVALFYDDQLFNKEVRYWLIHDVLRIKETEYKLLSCKAELEKYKDELDENTTILPTIRAIVIEQNKNDLEYYLHFSEKLLENLIHKIEDEFISWYKELDSDKNKKSNRFIAKRLLGEWVLRQSVNNNFPIDLSLSNSLKTYIKQADKYPNYPTKFPFNPVNNLTALSTAAKIEIIESIINNSRKVG